MSTLAINSNAVSGPSAPQNDESNSNTAIPPPSKMKKVLHLTDVDAVVKTLASRAPAIKSPSKAKSPPMVNAHPATKFVPWVEAPFMVKTPPRPQYPPTTKLSPSSNASSDLSWSKVAAGSQGAVTPNNTAARQRVVPHSLDRQSTDPAIPTFGAPKYARDQHKSFSGSNLQTSSNEPKKPKIVKEKPQTDKNSWTTIPIVEKAENKNVASSSDSCTSSANCFHAFNITAPVNGDELTKKLENVQKKSKAKRNRKKHKNKNEASTTPPVEPKLALKVPAIVPLNVEPVTVASKTSPPLSSKKPANATKVQLAASTTAETKISGSSSNKRASRSTSLGNQKNSWAAIASKSEAAIKKVTNTDDTKPTASFEAQKLPTDAHFPAIAGSTPPPSTTPTSAKSYATVLQSSQIPVAPVAENTVQATAAAIANACCEAQKGLIEADFPALAASPPCKSTTSSSTRLYASAAKSPEDMAPQVTQYSVHVTTAAPKSRTKPAAPKALAPVVDQQVDDFLETCRPHRKDLLKGPKIIISVGGKSIRGGAKRMAMAVSPVLNKHFTKYPESVE